MTDSPWIADVTTDTFRDEVVERSKKMPVVVDFWADWCGPCKALGPQLERLAVEGDGRFFLAKIDVDKSPELAQMFQVQSIPMVVGLAGGRPVDAFTGAQPEPVLREFLDRVAPASDPGGDLVAQADELAGAGEGPAAIALLAEHLAAHPDDLAVRIALARHSVDAGDVEAAQSALAGLDDADGPPELLAVRKRIELAERAGDIDALRERVRAAPDDLGLRIELGRTLIGVGREEDGLEELLGVVSTDAEFGDQAARKAMLEAFEALGEENPLVGDYRRRLQMVLF